MSEPAARPRASRGEHRDRGQALPTVTAVRRPARQQRSQATLERILDAAGRSFDEAGVEGSTMDAIAERAGTSIGSVYRFFKDNAGYATPPGCAACALSLARAEIAAEQEGLTFEWNCPQRRRRVATGSPRFFLSTAGRDPVAGGNWLTSNLERPRRHDPTSGGWRMKRSQEARRQAQHGRVGNQS